MPIQNTYGGNPVKNIALSATFYIGMSMSALVDSITVQMFSTKRDRVQAGTIQTIETAYGLKQRI